MCATPCTRSIPITKMKHPNCRSTTKTLTSFTQTVHKRSKKWHRMIILTRKFPQRILRTSLHSQQNIDQLTQRRWYHFTKELPFSSAQWPYPPTSSLPLQQTLSVAQTSPSFALNAAAFKSMTVQNALDIYSRISIMKYATIGNSLTLGIMWLVIRTITIHFCGMTCKLTPRLNSRLFLWPNFARKLFSLGGWLRIRSHFYLDLPLSTAFIVTFSVWPPLMFW